MSEIENKSLKKEATNLNQLGTSPTFIFDESCIAGARHSITSLLENFDSRWIRNQTLLQMKCSFPSTSDVLFHGHILVCQADIQSE